MQNQQEKEVPQVQEQPISVTQEIDVRPAQLSESQADDAPTDYKATAKAMLELRRAASEQRSKDAEKKAV